MRFTPGRSSSSMRSLMRLQLTSMIDVIFLLLIFFMTTTTLSSPEARLSTGLQTERDDSARAADFQPQIVEARMVEGAPAFVLGERVFRDKAALTRTCSCASSGMSGSSGRRRRCRRARTPALRG